MAPVHPLLIAGNWKMHTRKEDGAALALAVANHTVSVGAASNVNVAISPPFPYLAQHRSIVHENGILLGGQDCSADADGAHTGDVSASMLKDVGCDFVILGHSERRQNHRETDALVKAKCEAALKAGLHVILCIGETLADREQGPDHFLPLLEEQLIASLPAEYSRENLTIAYEPIWAIGTGKTATIDDITTVHAHLHASLKCEEGKNPRILYGGSVKANNALDILSQPVVDGVLVGGASLNASEFSNIIDAALNAADQR